MMGDVVVKEVKKHCSSCILIVYLVSVVVRQASYPSHAQAELRFCQRRSEECGHKLSCET
jgi:hypothetical protein